MGVMEAYSIFKQEHLQEKTGILSFAALPPTDVFLTLELPRNICVCKNHENLILLVECLHKFDERFPEYNSGIPLTWVCSEGLSVGSIAVKTAKKESSFKEHVHFHKMFVLLMIT